MNSPAASASPAVSPLLAAWMARWPQAIDCWSRYVKLSEPRWCESEADEQREGLTGSFAMIRLVDHAVVISLRQVAEKGLADFAVEILAHEIGHHVYTPADLNDNARLLARIRAGLPTREKHAPLIANLYEDLLINDRLQRSCGLNMAGVYLQLGTQSSGGSGKLWTLYMRIYELLWQLERGSLASGEIDPRMNFDAQLGARLIRSYSKEWLDGGGRFAALCLPYLLDDTPEGDCGGWCDALEAGRGGTPEGLSEIDPAELEGAIHPALDPDLSGVPTDSPKRKRDDDLKDAAAVSGRQTGRGGEKSYRRFRGPVEYLEVMKATGTMLSEGDIIARYYRERAVPHLVPFPVDRMPAAVDPHPEGTDVWDVGGAIEALDWTATVLASPIVIPGVTTRERLYGMSSGTSPEKQPVDLYLGVDCSGSMTNPSLGLSYPVVAGTILCLSALRAGAEVMVVLSGEPNGRTVSTGGFIRDEGVILKTLTGYLGTGYSFGIHRLADTFSNRPPTARRAHILIVSDQDIFSILEETPGKQPRGLKLRGMNEAIQSGWDVACEAAKSARGGATYVLEIPAARYKDQIERMNRDGWDVYTVTSQEEIVEFAEAFARKHYDRNAPR